MDIQETFIVNTSEVSGSNPSILGYRLSCCRYRTRASMPAQATHNWHKRRTCVTPIAFHDVWASSAREVSHHCTREPSEVSQPNLADFACAHGVTISYDYHVVDRTWQAPYAKVNESESSGLTRLPRTR